MSLLLAPMEGLLDYPLRDVLSRVGGIEHCVSEFIRVSGSLLPPRVFRHTVPELDTGSRTAAGVPVRVQLLGSDPACMADNAARVAGLGAAGVDLNFGCPAKTVNRHGGGAMLLDDPPLLGRIAAAVRAAVPAGVPVTAKMRLGVRDGSRAIECAQALSEGGAEELVVHARTKLDAYRPPAYWERIADIREAVRVPVVANGEIWTVADAQRCRDLSGCTRLMLGRGLVANPGLALEILAADRGESIAPMDWHEVLALMPRYRALVGARYTPKHQAGRMKQWLKYLRARHPEAGIAYETLKTFESADDILAGLLRMPAAA